MCSSDLFQDFGYDQAAHNYLIFEKDLDLKLTSNQQGIITTVSLEDAAGLEIDYRQELVKVGNRYPAIIHQYDRHPKLLSFFTELANRAEAPPELLPQTHTTYNLRSYDYEHSPRIS